VRLISQHTATGYADYGALTLRDADTDYGRMAANRAHAAYEDGLASTPYAVFLVLAELKLPVSLSIEVWDEQPADPPAGDGWSTPQLFTIASPLARWCSATPQAPCTCHSRCRPQTAGTPSPFITPDVL
jgi:hypothetical protein